MDADYIDGISVTEVTETYPRMEPRLFPQQRRVALPCGAEARVHIEYVAGKIRANAYQWIGGANPMADFVPTREQDEVAQEKALDLV